MRGWVSVPRPRWTVFMMRWMCVVCKILGTLGEPGRLRNGWPMGASVECALIELALATPDWSVIYHTANLKHLATATSDHGPILLEL
jgi:hypothetical protein